MSDQRRHAITRAIALSVIAALFSGCDPLVSESNRAYVADPDRWNSSTAHRTDLDDQQMLNEQQVQIAPKPR